MSEFIQITWTSGSIDEARRCCRYLVQERLGASARIIPWVEAIFMLNNQLETTQESLIHLVIPQARFEEVSAIIRKNSKYQIPEISCTPLQGLNEDYLAWLKEATKK